MTEIPLRRGFFAFENENDIIAVLDQLNRIGLVSLVKDELIKCKKCGNFVIVDRKFKIKGSGICHNCGKIVTMPKITFNRTRLSDVNFIKIIKYVDDQLKQIFKDSPLVFDKFGKYWIVERDKQKRIISIYGISNAASIYSIIEDDEIVIFLDPAEIHPRITNYTKSRFIYLLDPIFNDPEKFIALLESIDYSKTLNYLELKDQLNSFIEKSDPHEFETIFAPQFIAAIREKSKELKHLLDTLHSVKDTIVNTKYVSIGGPGQSDFALVDLFEYLQEGLKPEKLGEMKCYPKDSFTMDDFGKAIAHATSKDTLCIVSTDDIHKFVWAKILEYKSVTGYYIHVIIDRDLMLFLIHNLGLMTLIQ